MGDVARYHGGALQGKQAQKVLDCNRDGSFEVLDCIKDLEELHSKYSTALSCLADVSDALRYSGDDFDDEGVQNVNTLEVWLLVFVFSSLLALVSLQMTGLICVECWDW